MPSFHLKEPPPGTPVDVVARRIVYDSRRDVATAIGGVRITWGPYVLLARRVVYDRGRDRLEAVGEVHLREPNGNVLVADVINMDDRFRDGFARHLRLLMTNGAELKARYAVRRDGDITVYENVSYTACQACRSRAGVPMWELKSERATHRQREGRIHHENLTLEFLGAPIFWLPALSHPDPQHPRATGFLAPTFSYSGELGPGVAIPYFINLAPNYDLTLLPTFYARQGVLARAQWRHRVGNGSYSVDAGGIYQLQPNKVASPGDHHLRWFASARGSFTLNARFDWGFSGAVQSERTMMRRFDIDERDMILSRVWLRGLHDRNWFLAEAAHYRGLRDTDRRGEDPRLLPRVEHEYTFAPPVLGGALSLSSSVQALLRKRAHTPFTGVRQAARQLRLATRVQWRREVITAGGVVVQPFAELRGEMRATRDLPDPAVPGGLRDAENTVRLVPSAGLDVRWPLLSVLAGGRQVLAPIAQLIASPGERLRGRISNEDAISAPYTASTLFSHDRFSGLDRREGGVRANVGLSWSLLWDSGGFLRASMGRTYHLAGRNSFAQAVNGLQRAAGDWVAALALAPDRHFLLTWQGRFDAATFAPRDQEARLKVAVRGLELSASYGRFLQDDILGISRATEQLTAEGGWRFRDNWRLFGGWQYDIRDKWTMSRFIGIGYECDCFSLRLRYREDFIRDSDAVFDRAISLSVRLHTLGGGGVAAPTAF